LCDIKLYFFFFSSRRRHTRWPRDWSSDVCSSDLHPLRRHQRRSRPGAVPDGTGAGAAGEGAVRGRGIHQARASGAPLDATRGAALTASVASFLAQAQKKGAELPASLSSALLLAAIRLSEKKAQAIRPYQLLVDDDGALDLLTGDPPAGDAYAAPELRHGAVLPDDPRVLVYAAGALGYEL